MTTVVTRGFDCAYGPPAAQDAARGPFGGFWATYLRKRLPSSVHVLTPARLADYRAHHIPLVFLYEDTDPGRMVKAGAAGGAVDGAQAVADLAALGIPVATVQAVYFTADVDTSPADYPAIDAYLHGVASSKLGAARVGLYGEADLVDHCRAAGAARWFFQASAWSAHRIANGVHIYQGRSATCGAWQDAIGSVTVDVDEALQHNFGQWPAPAGPPNNPPGEAVTEQEMDHLIAKFLNALDSAGTHTLAGEPVLGTKFIDAIAKRAEAFKNNPDA